MEAFSLQIKCDCMGLTVSVSPTGIDVISYDWLMVVSATVSKASQLLGTANQWDWQYRPSAALAYLHCPMMST
jgi:hypothetical protein